MYANECEAINAAWGLYEPPRRAVHVTILHNMARRHRVELELELSDGANMLFAQTDSMSRNAQSADAGRIIHVLDNFTGDPVKLLERVGWRRLDS